MSHTAIYNTHPNVVEINGDEEKTIAWDKEGNVVEIDFDKVITEKYRIEAEEAAAKQAAETVKKSAHNKLAALGLTAEEIAALGK
jgi:hypothetical protein